MEQYSGLIQLILFVAFAASIFLFFYNRQLSERIRTLEAQLTDKPQPIAPPAPKKVEASRPAPAAAPAPEKPREKEVVQVVREDKKLKEQLQRESHRVRELDGLVVELRRQLESAQKIVRLRDADVAELRESNEALAMELENTKAEAVRPAPVLEPEPEVVAPEPVAAAPQVDLAEVEARIARARADVDEANRLRQDAAGRANLLEVKLRHAEERLSRMDKRVREIISRSASSEKELMKLRRTSVQYEQMYEMLKGRFDVARDLLYTFRQKFGVEIPTEIGVAQYSDMADHVELEEEEERPRPRRDGRSARPRSDRRAANGADGAGEEGRPVDEKGRFMDFAEAITAETAIPAVKSEDGEGDKAEA